MILWVEAIAIRVESANTTGCHTGLTVAQESVAVRRVTEAKLQWVATVCVVGARFAGTRTEATGRIREVHRAKTTSSVGEARHIEATAAAALVVIDAARVLGQTLEADVVATH